MIGMRVATTSLVAVAAVAGGLGAVEVYRSTSSADRDPPVVKREKVPEPLVPTIVPATRFEWEPCKPPAVQRGGKCVTRAG